MKLLAILEIVSIVLVGVGIGWVWHPGAGIAAAGVLLFLETGVSRR